MTERLDRIERLLEGVAQSQVELQAIVASNAQAIAANSNAIAELRESYRELNQDFRRSIEDVVGMIVTLAENVDTMVRQAEQDRVEFRATVQGILAALTQRFPGNGQA